MPAEELDSLTDSIRWLTQFPDSRMRLNRRSTGKRASSKGRHKARLQQERSGATAERIEESVLLAFKFYAMRAHLTSHN